MALKQIPKEGLTEGLARLKLGTEILRTFNLFFQVTTAAIEDKISKGELDLFIDHAEEMIVEKLRTLGYKSPDEIPAIERAAMERARDWIKKHPWAGTTETEYYLIDIEEFESELLGKGDKIKQEGE